MSKKRNSSRKMVLALLSLFLISILVSCKGSGTGDTTDDKTSPSGDYKGIPPASVPGTPMKSNPDTPSGLVPSTRYTGTLYMASERGGHVAVIDVTIDPVNEQSPLKVDSLNMIQLGQGPGAGNRDFIFHGLRLDTAANKLYWAALSPKGTLPGPDPLLGNDFLLNIPPLLSTSLFINVGFVDLAHNNRVVRSQIDYNIVGALLDSLIKQEHGFPAMYCSLALTDDSVTLFTMNPIPYIDVVPKSAIVDGATLLSLPLLGQVKRTYINQWRLMPSTATIHGAVSPDNKILYVAVNEIDLSIIAPSLERGYPLPNGTWTGYLMNTDDFKKGTLLPTPITSNLIEGKNQGTVALQSTYTPDGSRILQSGMDRFFVLDAKTLKPLNGDNGDDRIGGGMSMFENHQSITTPDGKYAILDFRYMDPNGGALDGGIQLYDLVNMKPVGGMVSTCNACHGPNNIDRYTCSIDGKLSIIKMNQ